MAHRVSGSGGGLTSGMHRKRKGERRERVRNCDSKVVPQSQAEGRDRERKRGPDQGQANAEPSVEPEKRLSLVQPNPIRNSRARQASSNMHETE